MKNLLKRKIKEAIEEDNGLKLKELISDKSLCYMPRLFKFFLDCCIRNKINCVKVFFEDPDIDIYQDNFSAFSSAASFNQFQVVDLFLNQKDFHPNKKICERVFNSTSTDGRYKVLKSLLKNKHFQNKEFYSSSFLEACKSGKITILKTLNENNLVDLNYLHKGLCFSALYNRTKTLKYLCTNFNTDLTFNNNEILINSIKSKSISTFKFLIKDKNILSSIDENFMIKIINNLPYIEINNSVTRFSLRNKKASNLIDLIMLNENLKNIFLISLFNLDNKSNHILNLKEYINKTFIAENIKGF